MQGNRYSWRDTVPDGCVIPVILYARGEEPRVFETGFAGDAAGHFFLSELRVWHGAYLFCSYQNNAAVLYADCDCDGDLFYPLDCTSGTGNLFVDHPGCSRASGKADPAFAPASSDACGGHSSSGLRRFFPGSDRMGAVVSSGNLSYDILCRMSD